MRPLKPLELAAAIAFLGVSSLLVAAEPTPPPGAAPTPEQVAAQAAERARQASLPDTRGTGRFPALKEDRKSVV